MVREGFSRKVAAEQRHKGVKKVSRVPIWREGLQTEEEREKGTEARKSKVGMPE